MHPLKPLAHSSTPTIPPRAPTTTFLYPLKHPPLHPGGGVDGVSEEAVPGHGDAHHPCHHGPGVQPDAQHQRHLRPVADHERVLHLVVEGNGVVFSLVDLW